VRDEYIDVAHGAARLLSQKYAGADVLRLLSVQPDRLVSYVAPNAWRYAQSIESLAVVAQRLSFFDRAAVVARDPATRLSSTSQTLAPDEIAFLTFSAEYRRLPHIASPKEFAGLSPLAPVVPKLLHLCRRAPVTMDTDGEEAVSAGSGRPEPKSAWRQNTDAASSRLRAELLCFADVGSATDDIAMDWLSLLPAIVLGHSAGGGSACQQPAAPTAIVAKQPPAAAKPKRTLFMAGVKPSAMPTPPAAKPLLTTVPDRVVTLLRERACFGGRRAGAVNLPVRSCFTVVTAAAEELVQTGETDDPITDDF
jgi:hypothetical protein